MLLRIPPKSKIHHAVTMVLYERILDNAIVATVCLCTNMIYEFRELVCMISVY